MVSNARLDLPEPESPVTTMRLSRGISSEMFLRLCTRAPCTPIVVRASGLRPLLFPLEAGRVPVGEERKRGEWDGAAFSPFGFVAGSRDIRRFSRIEEGDLLHRHVALLRQADGRRRLADEPLVRQVLARRGHAAHAEVALKVVLDLGARP